MLFLYELVVLSLIEREKKRKPFTTTFGAVSNCGLFTNLQIHIFLNIFFFLFFFYFIYVRKKRLIYIGRDGENEYAKL